MQFSRVFVCAALMLALAAQMVMGVAVPEERVAMEKRKETSHEEGVKYQGSEKELAQFVALSQETYCEDSYVGMKVGDSELIYSYGTGDLIQRVNLWKSESEGIVVALQGTNPLHGWSISWDALILLTEAVPAFRKSMPKDVRIFYGFQEAWVKVSKRIIPAVKKAMKEHNESRVSVTGHSLGASMGLVAATHLRQELGDKAIHRIVVFGLPRTGNPAFATYIDQTFGDRFNWVVNGGDPMPHLAPRLLGYQNPGNQIWINPANSGHYKLYRGQENMHASNSAIIDLNVMADHQGIYFHTLLWGIFGPCPAKPNNMRKNKNRVPQQNHAAIQKQIKKMEEVNKKMGKKFFVKGTGNMTHHDQ